MEPIRNRGTAALRAALLSLLVAAGCDDGTRAPAPSREERDTTASTSSATTGRSRLDVEGASPTTPAEPTDAREADALRRANAAADALGRTLRARLLAAMSEGGSPAAVRVCADAAQGLAEEVAREHGARVGRSSLRLRNPANRAPPWVAEWLAAQGERAADDAEGFARVEDGRARVLRPIAVEGPCVNCHGPSEAIAPEVAAILRERYPDDHATGYAVGDLRGALWAEVEVGR